MMDHSGLGICVIGRNEGRRLREVLSAVEDQGERRVYVDSASTDNSVAIARDFKGRVDLIQIPAEEAGTAALGRNRGFEHLMKVSPDLKLIQFVDGDCVLAEHWLSTATDYMRGHEDVGILAGRLREHQRERNYYHRLADMEWDTAAGDVEATGGICMVRAEAWAKVGGMDAAVAQGEEAELAQRVRAQGLRVVRLTQEMAHHDIDMASFGQWWTRTAREGQAVAETVVRNGSDDRDSLRQLLSMLGWGLGLPTAAVGLSVPTLGLSWALLAGYPVLWQRVRSHRLKHGDRPDDAALYATATVLGKIANASGAVKFAARRIRQGS